MMGVVDRDVGQGGEEKEKRFSLFKLIEKSFGTRFFLKKLQFLLAQ
jgi:hypothetical protein